MVQTHLNCVGIEPVIQSGVPSTGVLRTFGRLRSRELPTNIEPVCKIFVLAVAVYAPPPDHRNASLGVVLQANPAFPGYCFGPSCFALSTCRLVPVIYEYGV